MATVDELSVKVSAATADANAGINRTQNNLEELGDEANQTSRSFGRLSASAGGFTAAISTVSAVTVGTAVPAFATLSTVMAPLAVVFGGIAAAAGSLAAVFGGLFATGVITHTNELKSALADAKTEIIEIIQPLGEVFGPLLVDAVEALPALVQRIVDSLGPMDEFRQSLIRMGQTAMELIPQLTAGMFQLATQALPVLNQALTTLTNRGPGIFESLQDTFNEIFPLVVELGRAFAGILPEILEVGTTVATLLLPTLSDFGDVLTRVLEKVNSLQPSMKRLVVTGVALAPVLTSIASVLAGMSAPILAVVGALGTLGIAYQQNLGGFKDAVDATVPSVDQLRETGQETFEELQPAVNDASETITAFSENVQNNEWGAAFGTLGDGANRAVDEVEQELVGSSGSGGIITPISQSLANARIWLETQGTVIISEGFASLVDVSANVLSGLQHVLIGPEGESGILTEMVDQADVFLTETAPVLLKESAQAVGEAIRAGLIDITNPLRGEESEIWQMISGGITWLVKNVPQLAVAVGEALVNGIVAGFQGLIAGLVGAEADGSMWNQFKRGLGVLRDRLTTPFEELGSDIVGMVRSGMNYLIGTGEDTLVGDIKAALSEIGEIPANVVKDVFNSVVPAEVGLGPVKLPEVTIDAGPLGSTTIGGRTIFNEFSFDLPQLESGGFVEESGLANIHEGERVVPAAQVSDRGEVMIESGPSKVVVHVEGDTGVVRDVSAEVIRDKERRTKRRSGGTTTL